MPFEANLWLSDDRTTFGLTLPNMTAPQMMSADDLSDLIRHLARKRAEMLPAHENVAPNQDTPVSRVPAIRWHVIEDLVPGQFRLYLLHPGFGWLWMPLNRSSFDQISRAARMFLQARPVPQ